MKRWIVVTDLDGSLLDAATYASDEASVAVDALRRHQIPILVCTSKTRTEVAHLCQQLGISDPYVVENGGAIVWPNHVETFGLPYERVVAHFRELNAQLGGVFRGFSDMTSEDLSRVTGLDLASAERARRREFDEPFALAGADFARVAEFAGLAHARGLRVSFGGRFAHLHGDTNKGHATQRVLAAYPGVRSLGIGDSALDLEMLQVVDVPVAVARPDGSHDPVLVESLPDLACVPRPGPAGWRVAIETLVLGVEKR